MNRIAIKFSRRAWILSAVGVIILVFGGDWAIARSRLNNIAIEIHVEPESVVANGSDSSTLTIRITEGGQPRVNDLVQLWLGKGGGLLTPNWVYTDSDGRVIVTYTPNPYSRYDPQNGAEIVILDTSIARLIEVGKQSSVLIPLIEPES